MGEEAGKAGEGRKGEHKGRGGKISPP